MKPLLRLLLILLSIAIVVIALLPPEKERAQTEPEPTPAQNPDPTPEAESPNLIRDLLGGAAIDRGEKAKTAISDLNEQREKEFEESGL